MNTDQHIARVVTVPADRVRAVGYGVIIERTDQYSKSSTQAGIIVAGTEDGFEKKFMLGEVIAIGAKVTEVAVGDIVVAVKQTCHRLPNGFSPAALWKTEENALSIIAVLPNDPSTAIEPGIGISEGE